MKIQEKFGITIRDLRLQKGISQERLALDANIDRTYIGDIERGTRNVSLDVVEKLSRYFDISISNLLKIVEEHGNTK